MVKRALGGLATMGLDLLDMAVSLARPPKVYPPIPAGAADEPTPISETPDPTIQWGLKLPNGTVVWDNCLWLGNSLATPQDRTELLANLQVTAAQLGFDEGPFMACYAWARRLGLPSVAYGEITLVPIHGAPEEREGNSLETPPETTTEASDENPLPT